MKSRNRVVNSLEEDLRVLGFPVSMSQLNEDNSGTKNGHSKEDLDSDPIDGPVVTHELLDAILAIEEDLDSDPDRAEKILENLKTKNEDDPMLEKVDSDLREKAEKVVDMLVEKVAKKTRRAKAGSMAKKASYQCPPGTRKDPSDPAGRRCIRAAKAAGGAGKLKQQQRKKKRWSKSGKGKISGIKSSRWAARREDDSMSEFAHELLGLVEGNDESNDTIRDELIDTIGNVLELFSEEFDDEAVTRIFEEAYNPVLASLNAGRLDEGIMEDIDFIEEIMPLVTLLHKSMERIEASESGN